MAKRWRLPAAALLACVGGLAAPVAAQARTPSLRLFAGQPRVSVAQNALRAGLVDLGVWVTPVGGAFQIDVRRPGYNAWRAAQVDSGTGSTLRLVPANLVDPARGLRRFFTMRFVDSHGRIAARRTFDFCPNGESARVDDSGPLQQSYPFDCSSAGFFPFVRGMVWGIDPGWAVKARLSTFPGFFGPFGLAPPPLAVLPPRFLRRLGRRGISLRPGRYTANVSITPAYQRTFGIPAAQTTVTLRVRVLRSPAPAARPPAVGVRRAQDASVRPLAVTPVTTAPDPATMPNLVALPAWRIGTRRSRGHDLLTFSATIWNAGPAPLSIEGFRRPHSDLMDAYEYFFDSRGNAVGRAPAGTMFYDNGAGHHHWHLRQLAAYTLVGASGEVVRSHKQSFCIAPGDPVDLTVPGAARAPTAFIGLGFGGSVCDLYSPGAIWLREQLTAGWGDTYTQAVAGQAFDITHVPNGAYRIEVRVNPLGQLTETTTSDDLAVRVIRLSGHLGARRVRVAAWHGIRA